MKIIYWPSPTPEFQLACPPPRKCLPHQSCCPCSPQSSHLLLLLRKGTMTNLTLVSLWWTFLPNRKIFWLKKWQFVVIDSNVLMPKSISMDDHMPGNIISISPRLLGTKGGRRGGDSGIAKKIHCWAICCWHCSSIGLLSSLDALEASVARAITKSHSHHEWTCQLSVISHAWHVIWWSWFWSILQGPINCKE